MTEHKRFATLLVWAVLGISGCDGGRFCFPVTQAELDEALADEGCLTIRVHDFDAEHLEAATERDDVELSIDPEYCVAFNQCRGDGPVLKTAHVDNIATTAVDLDAVVVNRYRSGSIRVPEIELTFGEVPAVSPAAAFTVVDGGSVKLHATASMDGWRQMLAAAKPSWVGVDVEVDAEARPTTALFFDDAETISLEQARPFGALAETIHAGRMLPDVLDAYAVWLESEGFDGTLYRAEGDDDIVVLPRSSNP